MDRQHRNRPARLVGEIDILVENGEVARAAPPMVTVTPPRLVGGFRTSFANAIPAGRCVPKPVIMLPGATLTTDHDATIIKLTIR